VQTTLLGLAIAIILALVAALVAPLVIDWNHYRAAIESEANRLTGLAVHVNGGIDARLLPSPAITLRDVAVGEPGHAPALRAGTLKLEIALAPLLRGNVQASEVRLIAPQFSLVLDKSGTLDLPQLSPAFRPEGLSISRFAIEDGRAALSDAASGARVTLEKLTFNGDVRSFAGPFSGDGNATIADAAYNYRIVGSAAEHDGIKLRLNIDPADRPLTTVFDGTLSFDRGVPHFDGAMSLARPVGATLANGRRVISEPWRATAALHLTPAAASLHEMAIHYGPEERAVVFGGSADLVFGPQPHLNADVSAMQVNLDRALANPDLTNRPPLVAVRSALQTFAADAKMPLPARIGFRVGALTIGGAALESLHGAMDFDPSGWSLDGVQFDAPGMTEVTLGGRLTGTSQRFVFRGPAALSSADAGTLLAWLNGRTGERGTVGARALTAQGDVTIASERVAVDNLDAALDRQKVAGRLAYAWPDSDRPAKLDADLKAADLDLDAIQAFVASALGGEGLALPQEATLALDIGRASFAGVQAKSILMQVNLDAGKLQIDRLSVGDLGGATLAVGGRIEELSSQPRGQVTFDLDARALDGLSDIAAKFAPSAAAPLRRLADRLAPAKVHATLTLDHAAGAGSAAALSVNGNLAAMRLTVSGKLNGAPGQLRAAAAQIDGRLDADDGTALVALFGLDHVVAVDQLPGQLIVSATGPLDGELRVSGKIAASGLDSAINGSVRLSDAPGPWAKLQLRLAAGDLRPLQQAMTGQPGVAVPVAAQATVAIDGDTLSFTDISATVAKASVHGQLAVGLATPIAVNGRIAADAVDGSELGSLLLGLPRNSQENAGAPRAQLANGAGAFGALNGAVDFKVDRAILTPALTARDLAGTLHFQPAALSIDDVGGSLAGGHLSASLAFRRNADALAAQIKVALTDASAATLLGSTMNIARGQLGLTLDADGLGASPSAIVGSLHGTVTASINNAQFAGLDPAVFTAALQAAGQTSPVDVNKVKAAVNAALASGRVGVASGSAALPIAAGAINLNHAVLNTEGGAELTLDGSLQLGTGTIDARLNLSQASPPNALIAARPELSVALKGPLGSPARTVDTSALVSWLTLRAAELQTRRIEAIEANRQQGAVAQAPHPDPPDLRMPLSGVVVETAAPANASSAPAPAKALERLQPAAAPPLVPDDDHPGSGNVAPPSLPPTSSGPKDTRVAPHPAESNATGGTADANRHPSLLQRLLPNILRTQ
jgi:large subunit ribosomal protein L24